MIVPARGSRLSGSPDAIAVTTVVTDHQSDFIDGPLSAESLDDRALVVGRQKVFAEAAAEPTSGSVHPAPHFTVFRSAAEEVAALGRCTDRWENEGGKNILARCGHLVLTSGESHPYKAVLTFEDGSITEKPFATSREGEAHIRHSTPRPTLRSDSRGGPSTGMNNPCD